MKLSVITINKNNAEGLEKSIQSVISQNFTDFEYIVIDGGSNDSSLKVIEKYATRISYWISEPDEGIYNAMNKGIKKAVGEYCLFLNSGDYLYSEQVLSNVCKSELTEDIIYGYIKMSNDVIYKYVEGNEITFSYFFNCTLPHPCSFIKRKLFIDNGYYNEKLKILSDWAFFLIAVCKHNVSIKRIDQIISVFNLNGISSDSDNRILIQNEKEMIFKQIFPRFIDDYKRLFYLENHLGSLKRNPIFKFILKIQKFVK